ncbi:hypothetical protein [Microbispora sp. NPDC049125]|uniref:hypothetical protein n=1 Tax=Microbispora sp. NPDC049125 TaxID=3154929 RepID=UPI0034654A67
MDPVTLIVSSVAVGAAAGLKDSAAQAVKDAYSVLKRLLRRHEVDVSAIERKPDSQAQREALKETLTDSKADTDAELLAAAHRLAELVRAHDPGAAPAVGVDLERIITEGALRVRDVQSTGTGVRARDVKSGGDIDISGIRAGGAHAADLP